MPVLPDCGGRQSTRAMGRLFQWLARASRSVRLRRLPAGGCATGTEGWKIKGLLVGDDGLEPPTSSV